MKGKHRRGNEDITALSVGNGLETARVSLELLKIQDLGDVTGRLENKFLYALARVRLACTRTRVYTQAYYVICVCMYVEVRGQRVREENLSQDKLIMVVILRCVTLPPPQSVDPVLLSDRKTRRSTGQGRKGWAEAPSKSLLLNTHLTSPPSLTSLAHHNGASSSWDVHG